MIISNIGWIWYVVPVVTSTLISIATIAPVIIMARGLLVTTVVIISTHANGVGIVSGIVVSTVVAGGVQVTIWIIVRARVVLISFTFIVASHASIEFAMTVIALSIVGSVSVFGRFDVVTISGFVGWISLVHSVGFVEVMVRVIGIVVEVTSPNGTVGRTVVRTGVIS